MSKSSYTPVPIDVLKHLYDPYMIEEYVIPSLKECENVIYVTKKLQPRIGATVCATAQTPSIIGQLGVPPLRHPRADELWFMLSDIKDVANFEVGQKIQNFVTDNENSTDINVIEITSVNRNNGFITGKVILGNDSSFIKDSYLSVYEVPNKTTHPRMTLDALKILYSDDIELGLPSYRKYHTVQIELKVCECGTEKHGFASHSTWCPMHENI